MDKKPRTPAQLENDKKLAQRARERKMMREAALPKGIEEDAANLVKAEATPLPAGGDLKDELLLKLLREVEELRQQQSAGYNPQAALEAKGQMMNGGVALGKNGLQGVVMRYPIEPSYYPNPIERLYDEPTLKRFNLRENYFFDWKVEGVEWEKANITYAEPRFTCRIFRRMFQEDGVTPSGQYALINRMILHEDEVVTRIAAEKLNLKESIGEDFDALMSEVRFFRIRQWLVDLFSVPKVESHNREPRQMVVDGKVVEMFDSEVLIDGDSGISKADSVSREVRI
jgi:hypothetical protein